MLFQILFVISKYMYSIYVNVYLHCQRCRLVSEKACGCRHEKLVHQGSLPEDWRCANEMHAPLLPSWLVSDAISHRNYQKMKKMLAHQKKKTVTSLRKRERERHLSNRKKHVDFFVISMEILCYIITGMQVVHERVICLVASRDGKSRGRHCLIDGIF